MLKFLTDYKAWILTVGIIVTGSLAQANTITWSGGDGAWNDTAQWGGILPNLAGLSGTDEAIINSGVVTFPGGGGNDFSIGNGILTINSGGTWLQAAVPNYLFIGNTSGGHAALNVNGGTFDTGGATAFNIGYGNGGIGNVSITNGGHLNTITNTTIYANSSLVINNGTVTSTSNIANSGTFSFGGGSVNVAVNNNASGTLIVSAGNLSLGAAGGTIMLEGSGVLTTNNEVNLANMTLSIADNAKFMVNNEFRANSNFTMNSGSLVVSNLISFGVANTVLTLAGGSISVGNNNDGIWWPAANSYIDITPGTSNISFVTAGNIANLIGDGRLRLNGQQVTLSDFALAGFDTSVANTLTYMAAIPEPSTVALLVFGGLTLAGTIFCRRQLLQK